MAEVEHFLKTTIVGILLLGAAGSIAAVGVLKALGKIKERARPAWSRFFRQRQGDIIGHFNSMASGERSRQTAYFAFHLSRAITCLGLFAVLSISAVLMLSSNQPLIFGRPIYLYLLYVSSLVTGYWSFKHLFIITTIYRHFCAGDLGLQKEQAPE